MKTNTKNLMIFLLIIVFAFLVVFVPKKYQDYQKSKEIPIDSSYKKFEEYEEKLKTFADLKNLEFSCHSEKFDDSFYKTIMFHSNADFNIDFQFNNFHGIEEYEITISCCKENTNILSIIDYELIDEVFKIVFDKSYKDRLKKISDELSNVNCDGTGKTMYLDRKNEITVYYMLYYGYESKGVKSENYISSLIIERS